MTQLDLDHEERVQLTLAIGGHIEDIRDAIVYLNQSIVPNMTAMEILQRCLDAAETARKKVLV